MPETVTNKTWTKVALAEICEEIGQRVDNPAESGYERFVGLEHLETGETSIHRWGSTEDVSSSMKLFKTGDVIVARRNVYLRRAARAGFDGVCSGDGIVLRAKESACLPELMPFLLNTDVFWEYVISQADGTMSKRITVKRLMSYELALPPRDKQRRIAEALTTNVRLINSLELASRRANVVRLALRCQLFSRGLRGAPLKKSIVGPIPENWDVRPLGEVFELLDNKRIPIKESERKNRQGPYPYYGASGSIDFVDDYIFDEPTLLLAEDGMNLVFRNSPIVCKATGQYWVNNHAHVLRPREGGQIDFYLEYLEHLSYLPYITGTYQKKITRRDCEAIPLVFPDLDEQMDIVNVFETLGQAYDSVATRRDSAKSFIQRLLAEVFV
jgi:type I restriction enzyme, S subunit